MSSAMAVVELRRIRKLLEDYIDQAGTLIPSQAFAWLQPAFPRYAGVATAATKLLVHGDVVTHGAYTT